MIINIQALLLDLHLQVKRISDGDSWISSEAHSVLNVLENNFYKATTQEEKIVLFLGGTLYAMRQDEFKYSHDYDFDIYNIVNAVRLKTPNTREEIKHNIEAIGRHVLANLPDILAKEAYLNKIIYRNQSRPYFPNLATLWSQQRIAALLSFCALYKDNLEQKTINTDELGIHGIEAFFNASEMVAQPLPNRQNATTPLTRPSRRDTLFPTNPFVSSSSESSSENDLFDPLLERNQPEFQRQPLRKPVGSYFTPDQLEAIDEVISKLHREVESCWPYPNKDRKVIKIEGLIRLKQLAESLPVNQAIELVEQEYNGYIREGNLSTRTADLLDSLRPTQNLGNGL